MNLGDLNKVWEIKALEKPGEEEAKEMLEKIAKQVQPIMRKRKWRVKLLSEFWYLNFPLLSNYFLILLWITLTNLLICIQFKLFFCFVLLFLFFTLQID